MGIEVEMANRYHVPTIVLQKKKNFTASKRESFGTKGD